MPQTSNSNNSRNNCPPGLSSLKTTGHRIPDFNFVILREIMEKSISRGELQLISA
ncbi:hypothetical protein DSECCO2_573030 [anaerobic digester metagenome]